MHRGRSLALGAGSCEEPPALDALRRLSSADFSKLSLAPIIMQIICRYGQGHAVVNRAV